MRNAFLLTIILGLAPALSAKEIKVEYKDLSYLVKQDSKNFSYQNNSIRRDFSVKKCNEEQFKIFWAKYKIHKKDLFISTSGRKDNLIKLTENKKVLKVNPSTKLGLFLQNMPNQIMALQMNENIKCSK